MMAFLTFSACKKDALDSSNAEQIVTDLNTQTITERILEFKSHLNRGDNAINLRSGPYTDNEVILGVEGVLNMTYTAPYLSSGKTFVESQIFNVTKQNGFIDQVAVDVFYAEALAFVSNHFYCVCPDPDNQIPHVYDVELDSSSNNFLNLIVTSIVAIEQVPSPPSRKLFVAGDDYSATGNNHCQNNKRNAHNLISEYANFNLKPSGAPFFYTGIERKNVISLPSWFQPFILPRDFYLDFRTWVIECFKDFNKNCSLPPQECLEPGHEEDLAFCLDYLEMGVYLTNIELIVDN